MFAKMNDPGLDQSIEEDAIAVERKSNDKKAEAEEDEEEFLEPRCALYFLTSPLCWKYQRLIICSIHSSIYT